MGSRENPRSSGYPVEFKQAAIELYLTSEHRSLERTAKELGISPTTLKNWARQAKVDHGQAPVSRATNGPSLRGCVRRTGD